MPESTIYGLAGLAAMLLIAFYFAHPDKSSPAAGESSSTRINDAHRYDSHRIETRPRNPPFPGDVGHRIRPYFRCPHGFNREPVIHNLERFDMRGTPKNFRKIFVGIGEYRSTPGVSQIAGTNHKQQELERRHERRKSPNHGFVGNTITGNHNSLD
jgi:hypothetical protein